jgi:hypothetical protein
MAPDAEVLRAWLRAHPPSAGLGFISEVVSLFERLNTRLRADLGSAFQVGHSYFMVPSLDEERLRDIWEHQIRPLLDDYALLQPGRLVPPKFDELLGGDRRVPASRKRQLVENDALSH